MLRISRNIIIKSLQNETTLKENKRLNDWLNEDKKNVAFYFQIEEIWKSKDCLSDYFIKKKGWDKLIEKIENNKIPDTDKNKRVFPQKQLFRYAIITVLSAILISLTYHEITVGSLRNKEILTQHIICNNKGIQKTLLPDSSIVWLNKNSKISYSNKFDRERVVVLEGKGLFEIKKNESLPFVVRTANIDVIVTGTKFVMESLHENSERITLISGGIIVNYNDLATRKVVFSRSLLPNQQITIQTANGQSTIENIDADCYIAWKDGIYRFNNETLEQIVKRISQHYNVKIRIMPELKDKTFSGQIDQDYSIREVMDILQSTHLLKYLIVNNTVYINEY